MTQTTTPPITRLRPDLLSIAQLVQPASMVLDLGCADGALLAHLAERQVKGRGIELSEHGVLACVRRGLSVRQGNLEEGLADYRDNSFDYVILSQTLPFLNQPTMILREMLRVGRHSIVSFPNWGYWRYRWRLLTNGRFPDAPEFPPHWQGSRRWQPFTIADFRDFCRQSEVQIEKELFLSGSGQPRGEGWANLLAETAVFVLRA